MKDALSIHRSLLERQTPHEIIRLPRPINGADDLPGVLGLPPLRCLCTRVFACRALGGAAPAPRDLVAVIVPARTRPAAEAIADALAVSAVWPAPAALINQITDYAAGLVAPVLLPPDMPTLVEAAAASIDDVVYTATGEACTALGIHTLDLFALRAITVAPIPYVTEPMGPPAGDR